MKREIERRRIKSFGEENKMSANFINKPNNKLIIITPIMPKFRYDSMTSEVAYGEPLL